MSGTVDGAALVPGATLDEVVDEVVVVVGLGDVAGATGSVVARTVVVVSTRSNSARSSRCALACWMPVPHSW